MAGPGEGGFTTTLAAPLAADDLSATIADDPTGRFSLPAFLEVVSGPSDDPVREVVWFDEPATATTLATSTIQHRRLAGSTATTTTTHPVGAAVHLMAVPPVTTSHWCADAGRVDAVLAAGLNGIEFAEVAAGGSQVEVHLLADRAGLTADNFVLDGGEVVTGIGITTATGGDRVWTLSVDRVGDHTPYRLRVVGHAGPEAVVSGPPVGFDPLLATIDLRFHVDEPTPFDCRHLTECAPSPVTSPRIDYLARDWPALRRVMMDRLTLLLDLDEDPPDADLLTTLVEAIAHRGDQLSYLQDAVATEAYLGTARRRTSVRRHARLLDHQLAEGCNARAWVVVTVGGPDDHGIAVDLPGPDLAAVDEALPVGHDPTGVPGTRFLAGLRDRPRVTPDEVDDLVQQGALVFESLHLLRARSAHDRLSIHTWGDADCCLPAGSTSVTVVGDPLDDPVTLGRGDVVVLEEVVNPVTRAEADADPAHRHAVRLVDVRPAVDPVRPELSLATLTWHDRDALPWALPVSTDTLPDGTVLSTELAVVRGNVVLVDHGWRSAGLDDEPPDTDFTRLDLDPVPGPPRHRGHRAALAIPEWMPEALAEVTMAAPYDHADAVTRPAAAAVEVDERTAAPAAWVGLDGAVWRPRPDLLASSAVSTEFTVELDEERRASLRFGDDVHGRAPRPHAVPHAVVRVGNGPHGNVGADAITTIVDDGVVELAVRNPLPATGGRAPESIAVARRDAPQAFRVQRRAVTTEDWVTAAQQHPEVQRAAATRRWTGSWHTVFLTVDRFGGRTVDADFGAELRGFLDTFRLTGSDLEVDGPRFVPLDVALTIRVADGYLPEDVEAAVRARLSADPQPDGTTGFFHPDNFTFGQPVWLSQVLAAVGALDGVAWADLGADPSSGHRFDRLLAPTGTAVADGFIAIDRLEIARLDPDVDHPDRGRLDLLVEVGP